MNKAQKLEIERRRKRFERFAMRMGRSRAARLISALERMHDIRYKGRKLPVVETPGKAA